MSYAGTLRRRPPEPMKLPPWRARLLFLLLLAGMGGLVVRSAYLQGFHDTFLQSKGNARYSRDIEISAHRGMITDRFGEPLAVSTPVESIWANPEDVEATAQQLDKLAKVLHLGKDELASKLANRDKGFVYLKRQLPPDEAEKAVRLKIPGVALHREYRRFYPGAEVTAHLLGFTGVDDNGQEGLELLLQDQLAGLAGSERIIKDARGHVVEDVANVRPPKPGTDVALSLDSKLQYLAFREIRLAVESHHAKAGSIVVLDAKNGEVLALANWPSYNPNNRERPAMQTMRNHAVTDLFEPGSTMKPFTAAAALEAGKVRPDTLINTENGAYVVGGHKIRDTHSASSMTVSEIIQKSSNVGATKLALSLPPEVFWHNLSEAGFGALTGSNFPGEAYGRLRDFKRWVPIDQATMSYGNGISVNLLQLARAYTVFANDGELQPVTLTRRDVPMVGKKVFSERTAREVRAMLELVVQPGGTAPQAQINGYRVAGKTGTAHKLDGGHYVNKYIASFVGMAPASNPRLIVAVMVDEPAGAQYYGGQVAAPVFSNVMGSALRMMNIPNDAPLGNVLMPPAGEVIGEEV
jgi:cell division protein FtsI (penicillin-binding protein 3)